MRQFTWAYRAFKICNHKEHKEHKNKKAFTM